MYMCSMMLAKISRVSDTMAEHAYDSVQEAAECEKVRVLKARSDGCDINDMVCKSDAGIDFTRFTFI